MPRELSSEPAAVRARMRRAAKKVEGNARILATIGYKPVEEWDLEELAKGQPRDRNGRFSGPRPAWIKSAVLVEVKRRLITGAFDALSAHVGDAIAVVHKVMMADEKDDDGRPIVDARTRLEAAKFIIDHTLGKPKQRVDLDMADDAKNALLGALMIPDGKGGYTPAHPVFDGSVVEDDELLESPLPKRPRHR